MHVTLCCKEKIILAHIIKNCFWKTTRTLRRKLKVKSDPSGGENSSNNSSTLSDQSGDTMSVHSSEEEDSARVKRLKKLIHEEQIQSECEDSSDEPPVASPNKNVNFATYKR